MNQVIQQLLSQVYELEGLLLVLNRQHGEVPEFLCEMVHNKAAEIAALAPKCTPEIFVEAHEPDPADIPADTHIHDHDTVAVISPEVDDDIDADDMSSHDADIAIDAEEPEACDSESLPPHHFEEIDYDFQFADDDSSIDVIDTDDDAELLPDVDTDEVDDNVLFEDPVFDDTIHRDSAPVYDDVTDTASIDEPIYDAEPSFDEDNVVEVDDAPIYDAEPVYDEDNVEEVDDAPVYDDEPSFDDDCESIDVPIEEIVTVEEVLQRSISKNLSKAFTLNDHFRYRRELFGNSEMEMRNTINLVEAMNSFAEAEEYFYGDLEWDSESPEVKDFMTIIRNHFL